MPAAPALGGRLVAGVVHEDLPHRPRGHGEEVGAALPLGVFAAGELQIGLVDESGGLKGVPDRLARKVACREGAQLVVDEGQQGGRGGIGVFAAEKLEDAGHLSLGLVER